MHSTTEAQTAQKVRSVCMENDKVCIVVQDTKAGLPDECLDCDPAQYHDRGLEVLLVWKGLTH